MKWTGISKPQLTGMTVHQGLACSQTLHFLFRDRRARIWKWKPRGIYWPQAQGVEIKKEKRLWIGYSRVSPCIFIGTHLYRWVGPPFFLSSATPKFHFQLPAPLWLMIFSSIFKIQDTANKNVFCICCILRETSPGLTHKSPHFNSKELNYSTIIIKIDIWTRYEVK